MATTKTKTRKTKTTKPKPKRKDRAPLDSHQAALKFVEAVHDLRVFEARHRADADVDKD